MTDDFIATLPGMASAAADEAAHAGRLSVAELLRLLQQMDNGAPDPLPR